MTTELYYYSKIGKKDLLFLGKDGWSKDLSKATFYKEEPVEKKNCIRSVDKLSIILEKVKLLVQKVSKDFYCVESVSKIRHFIAKNAEEAIVLFLTEEEI